MKKIVTLVALLAVVSSPAFAAPKKKTTVKTTTTTTTTAPSAAADSTYSTSSSAPMHDGFMLSGEFGLGTLGSKFAFGVGFRAEAPVSMEGNHFRFGGQTGFYFGPSDPTTWTIPILAIGSYDFHVTQGTLKPYLGLGLGISISHVSGVSVGNVTIGGGSSTDFMWQFKPGVGFGNEGKLYAELPLGTIAGTFYILPSVGMHF